MDSHALAGNADFPSSTGGSTIKIGVLGGIGPEATGEFYSKLIKRLQEKRLIASNSDFPQIIINSIPAPELINDGISDEELKPYFEGLELLDKTGVDFIVMVCNTIHLFYDNLQGKVRTPILDIRAEVKRVIEKKKIKSVLLLGTPSTIKEGLYRFDGINYVELTDSDTKALGRSIFDFNRGFGSTTAADICKKYLKTGADMVILACTEFALMLDKEDMPKISTIDVMVDATIDKFLSLKYQDGKEIINR